jgi:hypothetical protein
MHHKCARIAVVKLQFTFTNESSHLSSDKLKHLLVGRTKLSVNISCQQLLELEGIFLAIIRRVENMKVQVNELLGLENSF